MNCGAHSGFPITDTDTDRVAERRAAMCRLLIAEREIAGRLLDKIFIANPLWDILLEIYLAESEGRLVYQSCLAPSAPPANPHRQSRRLAKLGIVERAPDPLDNRRMKIRLTQEIRAVLDNLMDLLSAFRAIE